MFKVKVKVMNSVYNSSKLEGVPKIVSLRWSMSCFFCKSFDEFGYASKVRYEHKYDRLID